VAGAGKGRTLDSVNFVISTVLEFWKAHEKISPNYRFKAYE
jgi:hypothetical protein